MFLKLFNRGSKYAHTDRRVVIESTHFRGLLNLYSKGWRKRRRTWKALFSGRDAILTPEPDIFSIVGIYITHIYLYLRLIATFSYQERRNRDLYFPKSAACCAWLVDYGTAVNKFSRAHKKDNDPHNDWFYGLSKSFRWIVAPFDSISFSCIICDKFVNLIHCIFRQCRSIWCWQTLAQKNVHLFCIDSSFIYSYSLKKKSEFFYISVPAYWNLIEF